MDIRWDLVNMQSQYWGLSSPSQSDSYSVQVQRWGVIIFMISPWRGGRNCPPHTPCNASFLLCVQCISFPDYISCNADKTIYCGLRLQKNSFLRSLCLSEHHLPLCVSLKKKLSVSQSLENARCGLKVVGICCFTLAVHAERPAQSSM